MAAGYVGGVRLNSYTTLITRHPGLAVQYKARRDFFIDALHDEFHLRMSLGTAGSWKGCTVYSAFAKAKHGANDLSEKLRGFGEKPLFSLVAPTGGMFLWLKIHFENAAEFEPDEEETPEVKLWTAIAKAGVLIGPGRYFASDEDDVKPVEGHFRISFSYASVRHSFMIYFMFHVRRLIFMWCVTIAKGHEQGRADLRSSRARFLPAVVCIV